MSRNRLPDSQLSKLKWLAVGFGFICYISTIAELSGFVHTGQRRCILRRSFRKVLVNRKYTVTTLEDLVLQREELQKFASPTLTKISDSDLELRTYKRANLRFVSCCCLQTASIQILQTTLQLFQTT